MIMAVRLPLHALKESTCNVDAIAPGRLVLQTRYRKNYRNWSQTLKLRWLGLEPITSNIGRHGSSVLRQETCVRGGSLGRYDGIAGKLAYAVSLFPVTPLDPLISIISLFVPCYGCIILKTKKNS